MSEKIKGQRSKVKKRGAETRDVETSGGYDARLSAKERKRHGVFYTPEALVEALLRATAPRGPVADLSCGDGAFLVAAARLGIPVMGIERDAAALARARERLEAHTQAIQACDYTDGAAQVWLQEGDGSAIQLPWMPDVVLGNPPYLEAKKADAALKARLRARYPGVARGAFDAYVCFLQAALEALPEGGRLGYVLPNKFLIARYAAPLRASLLAQTTILEVIDVSDAAAFRDAHVYPILLTARKGAPPPGHLVRTGIVTDVQQLADGNYPQAMVAQEAWGKAGDCTFWIPPAEATATALVGRLMADREAVPLGQALDIRWTISFHRAGLREQYISPEPRGQYPRRLLGGMRYQGNGDIGRYRTRWSGWWIDFNTARAARDGNVLPPEALFTGPKLVIAQNARRIVATLDREGYACKDTFLVGLPHPRAAAGDGGLFAQLAAEDGGPPVGPSLPYVLALLNSALLSFLYGVLFRATHVAGGYLHYLACYLDELPLRLAGDEEPFVRLVERLLDPATPIDRGRLTEEERGVLDTELDDLVFDLYGVSEAERAVVRAAVPSSWGEAGPRRGDWDRPLKTGTG